MSWPGERNERRKNWGLLNKSLKDTWESPINRDSDFVAHTTKPYTFFDNISMILDMEKNPVLILSL